MFATSLNSPFIASAFIFIAYTLANNTLTPSKVFPTLFVLQLFKIFAGLMMAFALQFISSYLVGKVRIEAVLKTSNLDQFKINFEEKKKELKLKKDTVIYFKDF